MEHQYKVIGGIGGIQCSDALGGGAEETNKIEEAFIPLLDEEITDPQRKTSGEHKKLETPSSQGEPNRASTSGRVEVPWLKSSARIVSPSLRLHNEIVELCCFLAPTPEETAARKDAVQRVTEVVISLFQNAKVDVFGSFVTGLYLPTSDMDLVVRNSGCFDKGRALTAIGNTLVERGMAKNIQVITRATVPIVKFDDVASGLAFDISLDLANGPKSAALALQLMDMLPPMRYLVIILKLFLQQRELNEVYQGGIGSYGLLTMVASFLMQHISRVPTKANPQPSLEENLGLLLLDFFRFYGRTLNIEKVGISCRGGGSFFLKSSRHGFYQRDRPRMLAIEDPQDITNDLGKGSYNISRVQSAFDFAYRQLSFPGYRDESLLQRIVRLDAVLLSRAPTVGVVPPRQPTEAKPLGQISVVNDKPKKRKSKKRSREHRERDMESVSSRGRRKRERDLQYGDDFDNAEITSSRYG